MPDRLTHLEALLERGTPMTWMPPLVADYERIISAPARAVVCGRLTDADAALIVALRNSAESLVAIARAAQAWLQTDEEYGDDYGDVEWNEARTALRAALHALDVEVEEEAP